MKKTRLPSFALRNLRQARSAGAMENASFGFDNEVVTYRGKDYKLDDFIKERTRLYRDSYVVGPLDGLIAWGEGK